MKITIITILLFCLILIGGCNKVETVGEIGIEDTNSYHFSLNDSFPIRFPTESTPYIRIDCKWLLNDTLVTWEDLNISFDYNNDSVEIDSRSICEELIKTQRVDGE